MTRRAYRTAGLLAATALCSQLLPLGVAHAQDASSQISSIERQIRALQGQLAHMKHDIASRDAEVKAARQEAATASRQARETAERFGPVRYDALGRPLAPTTPLSAPPGYAYAGPNGSPYMNVNGYPSYVPSGPKLKQGQFQLGGVRVTLGGFVAAEGIWRSRNQTDDISSSFNSGIPFANSANHYSNEFRETARQSRLSLLAEGDPDVNTHLAAYFEMDFQSSGSSSNSRQSNSYSLRERVIYGTYARKDMDLYVLAGQNWSMATMNKIGITPRQENAPLTIDASYVPGFVWKRQTQLRVVKGFNHDEFDIGLSLEDPEANFAAAGTVPHSITGATITSTNAGDSTNNPDTTYSDNVAPDIIVKGTADPGWGHYELFGMARFLHDRVSYTGSGSNHTVVAGGGGFGMILPIVKGKLEFQASGLFGEGIGTYGAAGLTDATYDANGSPRPIPEEMGLVGLVGHPTKKLDVYAYGGVENEESTTVRVGKTNYGYGSYISALAGCDIELGTCAAQTKTIAQGTAGLWWKAVKGDYGTVQLGAQYSYTHRTAFEGATGGQPKTDNNMVFLSFRYYPFQ